MLPKRRKAQKMGVREEPQIRCPGHLSWVRGHVCAVPGMPGVSCSERVEAAHIRIGTDGGMGVKPSDCFTIPLCSAHHAQQHALGEDTFFTLYKIKPKALAEELWLRSPAGIKWRASHE